jgi:hypothetical protein
LAVEGGVVGGIDGVEGFQVLLQMAEGGEMDLGVIDFEVDS